MSFFIIFMGVSGCGKTTIGKMTAEALRVPYYEGDEHHPQENVEKMSRGIPLNDEDREGWLHRLSDLIQDKLEIGETGILSCSALKKNIEIDYGLILKRFILSTSKEVMGSSESEWKKGQSTICQLIFS